MAAETSALAFSPKSPSSSEASASSGSPRKKQLKIETGTPLSVMDELAKYWEKQAYRIETCLPGPLNQCFLLSKESDPDTLYLAKVTDLRKRPPSFTKADRGEILVRSIPSHKGVKTIANRYFFGNKEATLKQTPESECVVFISTYDPGIDLFDFLANRKTLLRLGLALDCAIKIGEAVSHLHQQGIIYRDLKPENVLVKKDGSICLIDFEYAKPASPCEPLSPVGSPAYMPPEAFNPAFRFKDPKGAHELGYQHDSFSFGALLFFLITNRPLFDSKNPAAIAKEIYRYGKGTTSLDLTDIKDELVLDVIRGLLAPNPENRITVTQATEMLTKIKQERDPTHTI